MLHNLKYRGHEQIGAFLGNWFGAELKTIAETCRRVPAKPARTFQEAIQSAYFVHLISQIESNGHSFSLGRFDQYTFPFYQADKISCLVFHHYLRSK